MLTNASIYAPEEPCNRAAIKRIGILERPSPLYNREDEESCREGARGGFQWNERRREVVANGVIELLVRQAFF